MLIVERDQEIEQVAKFMLGLADKTRNTAIARYAMNKLRTLKRSS